MNTWRFHNPWWILAGAVLVALICWRERRAARASVMFSSAQLVSDLPISWAQRAKRWLPPARWLGLALLALAAARPQQGLRDFRLRTEGIAIAMCLDRSGSMAAMDFALDQERVDRLTAVKRVFREFLAGGESLSGRADDQVALIVFGGFAEARSPLTLDHASVLRVLEDVRLPNPRIDDGDSRRDVEIAEQEMATAIGDALAAAVDRLRQSPAKTRIVILLSDGENTAGELSPQDGAKAAQALGIKVYCIGVGRTGQAPFPRLDPFGNRRLVTQFVRLDEATLKQIAATTGGSYFHAENTDSLVKVCEQIDRLEKTTNEGRLYTEYREWYAWLAIPALTLLAGEAWLRATRFRSTP